MRAYATPTATPPPATPTPNPTLGQIPAASAAARPVQTRVCTLAQQVDRAISAEAPQAFVDMAVLSRVDCSPASPLASHSAIQDFCAGLDATDLRYGLSTGHRPGGDGPFFTRPQAVLELKRWHLDSSSQRSDQYGPGEFRLHSIGCPVRRADLASCGEAFEFLFSGISRTPEGIQHRRDLIVRMTWPAGSDPSYAFWTSTQLQEAELLGGEVTSTSGGFSTYMRWRGD